ncbi:hypothetical protein [Corynebacterium auris]|uniref:hypothetical protein n=1 Tax=Corynebacterium auris TaxID=44750 RepID=UPI0025B5AD99|nr:hypothetical protein [Corynebacterium auris]WJY67290.1 hypothetical protein CAURIS_01815 [Corynebacterium auris]
MRQRAEELRREKGGNKKARNLEALQALIEEMPDGDRSLAAAIHLIVSEEAPHLDARTWYGMPAWEDKDGVVVFLQVASKFDARYSTLGFEPAARLDEGAMWPTSFALLELTGQTEAQIRELVRRAAPRG